MRKIKFRAWDKERKEMYKPRHEAYKGKLFELMVGFKGDLLAHTMTGVDHESMFPSRFELMQFTGLLDRNGKEIYEGDVVRKIIKGGGRTDPVYEVVYDSFLCSFNINGKSGHEIEIIGNIYENSELLTLS